MFSLPIIKVMDTISSQKKSWAIGSGQQIRRDGAFSTSYTDPGPFGNNGGSHSTVDQLREAQKVIPTPDHFASIKRSERQIKKLQREVASIRENDPGGPVKSIQFSQGNSFGGSAALTTDGNGSIAAAKISSAGSVDAKEVAAESVSAQDLSGYHLSSNQIATNTSPGVWTYDNTGGARRYAKSGISEGWCLRAGWRNSGLVSSDSSLQLRQRHSICLPVSRLEQPLQPLILPFSVYKTFPRGHGELNGLERPAYQDRARNQHTGRDFLLQNQQGAYCNRR